MNTPTPTCQPEAITLDYAMEDCFDTKVRIGLTRGYAYSLRLYWRQFAKGREDKLIATIGTNDIAQWFQHRKESPRGQLSNTGRLSALFAHCWRRGWIEVNPCDRLEKPKIKGWKSPTILTPEQAEYALDFTHWRSPVNLGWLALGLLGGLRPEEAGKMTWGDINLERGVVRVEAGISKVQQRRVVRLHPNAVAWLKVAKEAGGVLPIKPQRRKRWVRNLRMRMGFYEAWPQDVLRHSCASYWLCETQDAAFVSLQLGNSPHILKRHYMALVDEDDAKKFWAIMPKARVSKNVPAEAQASVTIEDAEPAMAVTFGAMFVTGVDSQ